MNYLNAMIKLLSIVFTKPHEHVTYIHNYIVIIIAPYDLVTSMVIGDRIS